MFDNVWFAHGAGKAPILTGANLEVAPGEIIAITRKDNIGKSTVARLAAGQLVPDTGDVLVDGVTASIAEARTRGSVALVDHQNATVRGSVLDNLTLFRTEQIEAARAAARMIDLEGDINRLPRGYDTRLGEAATETLPVGFLQRIAIARAIASRPRLLILDEANGSFDYGSDQALGKGLLSLKGEITIVLITNRPSFAAIADRRFTLIDGQVQSARTIEIAIKGGRPGHGGRGMSASATRLDREDTAAEIARNAVLEQQRRLAAEFESTNSDGIGLASATSPFARMLCEVLASVGWEGKQHRIFEALPHLEPDPVGPDAASCSRTTRCEPRSDRPARGRFVRGGSSLPACRRRGQLSPHHARGAGEFEIYDLSGTRSKADRCRFCGTVYLIRPRKSEDSPR